MKLIAHNQLIGTGGGFAVFRNLFEKPDGVRVSVPTSREFIMELERREGHTLAGRLLPKYPPESAIFERHKL